MVSKVTYFKTYSFKTINGGQFRLPTQFIMIIHRLFYQFTGEITHAGCCENTRKVFNSELEVSELLFFPNGFPTSGDKVAKGKEKTRGNNKKKCKMCCRVRLRIDIQFSKLRFEATV